MGGAAGGHSSHEPSRMSVTYSPTLKTSFSQTYYNIPALTGRPPLNCIERDLLSLPARHGGIGLVNSTTCDHNYVTSKKIMELHVHEVLSRAYNYSVESETISVPNQINREAQKQRNDQNIQKVCRPQNSPSTSSAERSGTSSGEWCLRVDHNVSPQRVWY